MSGDPIEVAFSHILAALAALAAIEDRRERVSAVEAVSSSFVYECRVLVNAALEP